MCGLHNCGLLPRVSPWSAPLTSASALLPHALPPPKRLDSCPASQGCAPACLCDPFLCHCVPAPLSPQLVLGVLPGSRMSGPLTQIRGRPEQLHIVSSALPFDARGGATFQCLYEQAPLHIARSPRLCIICLGGVEREGRGLDDVSSAVKPLLQACNEVLIPFKAPYRHSQQSTTGSCTFIRVLGKLFCLVPEGPRQLQYSCRRVLGLAERCLHGLIARKGDMRVVGLQNSAASGRTNTLSGGGGVEKGHGQSTIRYLAHCCIHWALPSHTILDFPPDLFCHNPP